MTPDDAIREAQQGKLRPVYLLCGEEAHLADQVIAALRSATLQGGIAGLNEDSFHAGSISAHEVITTARTLPMLSTRRWILVRDLDKWDSAKSKKSGSGESKNPLDALVDYAAQAATSTVLVLVAPKLDKRRRLYTSAKKDGWLILCETPKRHELPGWILQRVQARGNSIPRASAELLAELQGPELAPLADAIERLCLYAGEGQAITEEHISACVVRLRTASVWELVQAVGRRDIAASLQVLDDVYDPQDRGLPLLGILGWATRQLLRFDAARKQGLSAAEAAKAAGAPPFKARELEEQLRQLSPTGLSRWIESLALADLDLKGGSRRPARSTLEQMLIDLCRAA